MPIAGQARSHSSVGATVLLAIQKAALSLWERACPAMALHATATFLLLPRFTHPTSTAAISTNPR